MKKILYVPCIVFLISCSKPDKPAISLEGFQIEEGFELELFASEPLIGDPVDMEIDENGDVYVVEMHGYPLDVHGSGFVKRLTDTDNDGYPDKSEVFVEGLILPTSIMRWKKGFIVTDAPDVLYFEDTDGDGKADVRKVMLTGFARSNPQHNLNTPLYGLDNWIYLAHEEDIHTIMFDSILEDKGSKIRFPDLPDREQLPQNAMGKSVRFKPEGEGLELLSCYTQFGHDFDNFGRLFMATNSNHIFQEILQYPYLSRKPQLRTFESVAYIPDHGNNAEVYPITKNAEHQLLTDIGVFTSACGTTIYNASLFPKEYQGANFVTESVHNLIHVDKMEPDGVTFKAKRMLQEREFLASEDPWFRPVNFYVGPDGALYMIDYYRRIIEHPEWMADEVTNSGELYEGTNMGRIYRIVPSGKKVPTFMGKKHLDRDNPDDLVQKLSHPDKWFRINAQRILVEEGRGDVEDKVRGVLANQNDSLGIVHALWTLEGLRKLMPGDILPQFTNPSPGVRENVIKMAEGFIDQAEIIEGLVAMAGQPQTKRVSFQLLLTLGYVNTQEAINASNKILEQYLDDEWMVTAGMTSQYFDGENWIAKLVEKKSVDDNEFINRIAYLLTMEGKKTAVNNLIDMAAKDTKAAWSGAFLSGVSQGTKQAGADILGLMNSGDKLMKAFLLSGEEVSDDWARLINTVKVPTGSYTGQLLKIIENESGDVRKKASAVSLLWKSDDMVATVKSLIGTTRPVEVQNASLEWLSKNITSDKDFCDQITMRWPTLSSPVRSKSIDLMMLNDERIGSLLTALEDSVVNTSAIGWRRSVNLMNSEVDMIKVRSRALLDPYKENAGDLLASYGNVNETTGDFEAGREVFSTSCSLCHTIGESMGTHYGPDLSSVKNQTKSAILKHILDPNASISDGFELCTVKKKDGTSLQGIIAYEDVNTMVLATAPGEETTVQRGDITDFRIIDMSAMPVGMGNAIGKKDMEDLLEFIKTFKRSDL